MSISDSEFKQSIRRQIAINRARTPTERMLALCELLDAARAMAPTDPAAQERRRKVAIQRQLQREKSHAEIRRFFARYIADAD